MTLKYESEIIKEIVDTRGHKKSSLHYESECVESWIEEAKGGYPKLCDYQAEWLNYINENSGIGDFPYHTLVDVTDAVVENVVPYAYKSAILKGSTKYRDIDTGDFLETFEDGRNLELVSVKMPVLTTSNEDGTKSNILSTPSDLELRGIGDVQDELNLLTGEVTQRIGEVVLDGTGNWQGFMLDTTKNKATARLHLPVSDSIVHSNSSDVLVSDKLKNSYWTVNRYEVNSVFRWDSPQPIIGITLSLDNDINTFDKFKSFLSKNPVKVYYQRITPPVKTVDLTIIDQDGNTLSKIKPIEGTMVISTDGSPIKPLLSAEIPVEATTQNLSLFIELEME